MTVGESNDAPLISQSQNSKSQHDRDPGSSDYTSSLWAEAVDKIRNDLPKEIRDQLPDNLDKAGASDILLSVVKEAEERQKDSVATEHQIQVPGGSGKKVKLRDVYGGILSFAMKFRDVGDIAIQASPPQAALPWAIVRLCLTAAFNKHEFYGVIIQGLEMVSSIVSHYVVIERIFVGVDSVNARAVRSSLLALYAAVLKFLKEALKFFPSSEEPDEKKGFIHRKFSSGMFKVRRTFRNLDVTYQESVKAMLTQVSEGKNSTDSDADHAYAEMNFDAFDRLGKQLDAMGYAELERNQKLEALREEFDRQLESIDYKVSEMYDSMKETQQHESVRRILDWLSPAMQDHRRETFHQSLTNRRLSSSGAWLPEDQDFVQWLQSQKSSIAWIRGTSGTGKTMLLSNVIDNLQSIFSNDGSSNRLAFFYVASGQGSRAESDFDEVIRNIVRQLAHTRTGLELDPAVVQAYQQASSVINQPPRPMRSECAGMIVNSAHEYPVWIIIDALDDMESGEPNDQVRSSRNDFIESLQNILDQSDCPVKILLSTLPDSPTETRLRNTFTKASIDDQTSSRYTVHTIEVNADRNHDDLVRFIDDTLTKRIHRGDLLEGAVEQSLKDEIAARILKRAKGMFSYASLAIDRLCDESISQAMVLMEIDEFHGMTDLYERSLREINTQGKSRVQLTAKSTMRWLLCLQETLSVDEFLETVDVEGAIEKPSKNNILSACRSLVKVDRHTSTGRSCFSFQHDAVRDYLKSLPEYSESDCNMVAADRCLRMMKVASFTSAGHSPAQIFFHWYANRFWAFHYQKIDFNLTGEDKALAEERRKGYDHVRKSLKEFVMQGHKTSLAFNKWLKNVPDYIGNLGQDHPLSQQLSSLRASVVTPLHAISVFGFTELIDANAKYFDFSQTNTYGQTALMLAIENKQIETVKALTESSRADVNQFNPRAVHQLLDETFEPVICYASSLQAAFVQGSRPIIEYLVAHGAKLDLVAGYYGSMLQAASLRGHVEIVSYLLDDFKVDPNTQGGFHGNALQAACASGNLGIVETLLGAEDAKVCELVPGGHYGSAFMAATCAGSPEIMESLLAYTDDAEAMVNQRSPMYGTPLQQAVDLNRKDLVDLLIGHGADINALGATEGDKSQEESSALATAARKGNQKIVQMLVEMNVEADFSYSNGQFHLLHRAALHDMLGLADYCVEKNCDVNMVTEKGVKYHPEQKKMTPLAIACAEGHINMVELLLNNSALIQYPGDEVSTLILAASRNHAHVVDAIIQQHKVRHSGNGQATVDFINRRVQSSKNTALHEAARLGCADAVAKLLEHNAPFLKAHLGVGVFQRAAWDGRPNIIKMLVEHLETHTSKSECLKIINAVDDNGKSALIDAAERNRVNVFPYLLQHGADIKVRDRWGNTLFHYLATRNHYGLLEALLVRWASEDPADKLSWLSVQNNEQMTALQEAIRRRHCPTMRILLDAGAQVTPAFKRYALILKEWPTLTDMQTLIREGFAGHQDQAGRFLNHRPGQDGFSILHDIATFGAQHKIPQQRRLDVTRYILDCGADPTTLDAESMLDLQRVDTATPLHHGVCENFQPWVRLLLERAVSQCDKAKLARFVNHRNRLGKTALMDAAERNHFELMDLLLAKPYSADWSIVDNNDQNALHWCAWRHHMPSVEILLRHASTVDPSPIGKKKLATFLNQRTKSTGSTPLHDVTHKGYQDTAKLLLHEYHADFEVYDNTGDSILHRAVQANHDELLRLYLECMARDRDQGKFQRVLGHRNSSMNRTVVEALEARGRKEWAEYVRSFGG